MGADDVMWLQSGHCVVNFSSWSGFQYLQNSSQVMAGNITYGLEKELKIHDYAHNYIVII